jgi:endonuclease III
MSTKSESTEGFPKGTGRPAISALRLVGYQRFEDLSGKSAKELLKLHGVGPKSIRVINEALTAQGMDPIETDE